MKWLKRRNILEIVKPLAASALATTALIIGVRQLGWLQSLELNFYDRLVQLQPDRGPDPRLLTVLITEADIQAQKKWPISDAVLAQALSILEQAQPRAIGLDLYRDLPVEPGHDQLSQQFANSDRIIAVCKLQASDQPSVAPPPSIFPEQVGFADIVVDPDGVVRRNLFYVDPQSSSCATPYALSLQLALWYLAAEGVEPEVTEEGLLKLGQATIEPIEQNTGAYHNIDANGYQIMLAYRSPQQVSDFVTLSEVLNGEVDPDSIEDRVVLIGVAAPSLKDNFYTPFRYSQKTKQLIPELMPGVVVHGQMVSQWLHLALDGQRLIWSLPEWQEWLWIAVWAGIGAGIASLIYRPIWLLLAELGSLSILVVSDWFWFTQAGWLPLVPCGLALVIASAVVVTYTSYKSQQEQVKIRRKVQEQEKSLALLKSLLKKNQTLRVGKVKDKTNYVLARRL